MTAATFTTAVSDEFIDAVAYRVADLVGDQIASASDAGHWMDVDSVAEYLCTTADAIRGMVKRRQIPFHRTPTGRLLFDRTEVDAWVRSEREAVVDAVQARVLRSDRPNQWPGAAATAPARHQEASPDAA